MVAHQNTPSVCSCSGPSVFTTHCSPPVKKFAQPSATTQVKPRQLRAPNSVDQTEHGTHTTSEAFILHTNVALLKGIVWTLHVPGGSSLEGVAGTSLLECPPNNNLRRFYVATAVDETSSFYYTVNFTVLLGEIICGLSNCALNALTGTMTTNC